MVRYSVTFTFESVKRSIGRLVGKAKNEHRARQEQSESDITADSGVAGSRAAIDADGDDGSYVGRESPQYDAEVQQSGAEARSEATRRSHDQT